MKFDVFQWNEVKTNEEVKARKGRLQLRLSAPCPLYLSAHGVEALAGYAASFDVETSEKVTFRIEAPEGVRAFRYRPCATSYEPEGESFTNIDRMPHESGTVLEVRKALRQMEIEKRAMLREIREERASLEQAQSARTISDPPADLPANHPVETEEAKTE